MSKILLTLTGPSCVGKGPLQEAVNRFYPGLLKARPVLCHSRPPRVAKGEVHGQHFYFLPPSLIKSLSGNDDFLVAPVRSDWQAIDVLQVADLLRLHDLVFAEVFYTFGQPLSRLATGGGFTTKSVFLLPTNLNPTTARQQIADFMRAKLKRRGTDLDKIDERADLAPTEMLHACNFTHRLLNPASEDDTDEWGEFGTRDGKSGGKRITSVNDLGPDARWLVETFVKIATCQLGPGDYRR